MNTDLSHSHLHPALYIENLCMRFGGLNAVNDLSLSIDISSIFGIIGPNGAGKTTVFNMLTGVYQPTSGKINAFDKCLVGCKPFQISAIGVSRTFQNIRLFKDLSVLNNIIIAADNNPKFKPPNLIQSLFRTRNFLNGELEKQALAYQYLELFSLIEKKNLSARNLPYGDQRRLEIARALATGAKIILLDEPAAGMTTLEKEQLMSTIRFIRDKLRITIVLIEHDMDLVMEICERIAVLDYGVKIAEGSPAEIRSNRKVIDAYLGPKKVKS